MWSAIVGVGQARVDDPDRVGPVEMVGFDETVMAPSRRRRGRRFVTAVVDVSSGQILDIFEGRDAADLRAWMVTMPAAWLAAGQVVSVDPHEGYRSAVAARIAIAPHTIDREVLSKAQGRGASREIPAMLLAKLALDRSVQGQGLGSELLVVVLETIVEAARRVGGRGGTGEFGVQVPSDTNPRSITRLRRRRRHRGRRGGGRRVPR